MTTAILSALPEEQSGLITSLERARRVMHAGRSFWLGHLYDRPVVLALSGIGKVAAATTATVLAERFGVARIVFTGVAGGVGEGVQVGDVVVAQDYVQHDMDASPLFERWLVPGYAGVRLPCDAALTAHLSGAVSACLAGDVTHFHTNADGRRPHCHQGLVASGDRFVTCAQVSRALREPLVAAGHDVLAVEMEGAAVAQVCLDYGLPFAAVRTISDRADDDAHVDFPVFIQTVASRYADHIVRHLLQSL
ncbi:MAG: 5'-methylthioadenosine/adenosylhomocysteine nucleosidase [Burkholderiales bacterium]|nr:5'-methylthioadenosine/adenosylhomocysteine nucleosidase [Burkholderiales bacterium]